MRKSASDPRILEMAPFGKGDYIMLGSEGLDRDGDGRIGEDGPGSYDGNRNWAADWQPDYVQSGALDYPFQLPEANAINQFLIAHPNIAGVQSYHNNGGMILRGPGAESVGEYPRADTIAYDELGQNGERMLPYYRYLVIWSGLYTVHGGFIDWTAEGLGILSFSNELWNNGQYYNSPALIEQQRDPASPITQRTANYWWNDNLEFGDQFVEWKEFDHPQFGKVEIGGWKKTYGRVPPRFMTEELCHRNMAFTLYQADEMPMMALGETRVESLGDGVFKVWVDLTNPKVVPTVLAAAARDGTVPPDILTLDGKSVEVISASCRPEQVPAGGAAAHRPEGPEAHRRAQRIAWKDHENDSVPGEGHRGRHHQVRQPQGRHGAEDAPAEVTEKFRVRPVRLLRAGRTARPFLTRPPLSLDPSRERLPGADVSSSPLVRRRVPSGPG